MKTILFIEDEANLQKSLGETLEQKGFKVLKALDGEIGWNLCRQEKPDLVLLDLILPKKDGFEVLSLIKATNETKNIPVVILTNLEGNLDIQRALELGATTFLVKTNYELNDILEKIEKILK